MEWRFLLGVPPALFHKEWILEGAKPTAAFQQLPRNEPACGGRGRGEGGRGRGINTVKPTSSFLVIIDLGPLIHRTRGLKGGQFPENKQRWAPNL